MIITHQGAIQSENMKDRPIFISGQVHRRLLGHNSRTKRSGAGNPRKLIRFLWISRPDYLTARTTTDLAGIVTVMRSAFTFDPFNRVGLTTSGFLKVL